MADVARAGDGGRKVRGVKEGGVQGRTAIGRPTPSPREARDQNIRGRNVIRYHAEGNSFIWWNLYSWNFFESRKIDAGSIFALAPCVELNYSTKQRKNSYTVLIIAEFCMEEK